MMVGESDVVAQLDALRRASEPDIGSLRSIVWSYYRSHARTYPWRETHDPWAILVSEVMLQQTQTDRVVPKYLSFLDRYPVPQALAESTVEDLLGLWKGLGYNRRALNLKRTAERIVNDHDGRVPREEADLLALPGIGPYTAAAIRAFAFEEPVVLIETNIRRLFLYVFFVDRERVTDREVLEVIAACLEPERVRDWYYALMDVGSMLARHVPNPNVRSRHYQKQARFEGSDRQIRGRILEELLKGPRTRFELRELPFPDARIDRQIEALVSEGFCARDGDELRLD